MFIAMLVAETSPTSLAAAARPSAQQILAALTPAPAPVALYAVRVGMTPKASRSTFIRDPDLPNRLPIAFSYWVVRDRERTILIDAGFISSTMRRRWKVEQYRTPIEGLSAIGLQPGDITDVVVTHHHWDHIEGLQFFAHARIWITARSLAGAHAWARRNSPILAETLEQAERAGRLHVTTGLGQITPHVVSVEVDLHAAGFQYVVVHDHDGVWVFASDVVPLQANLARQKATGLTTDVAATEAVMRTIEQLVGGDRARIVPGHEPGGFDPTGVRRLTGSQKAP